MTQIFTTPELDAFILNYKETDFWRINFQKYEGSSDINTWFRKEVSGRVHDLEYNVSIELLKDLFIEHAEASTVSWGCYAKLYLIGHALIRKGRVQYVLLYLIFSLKSFDTRISTGQGKWNDDELLLEIRVFLEQEKKKSHNEQTMNAIDFGLKYRFGLHNLMSNQK